MSLAPASSTESATFLPPTLESRRDRVRPGRVLAALAAAAALLAPASGRAQLFPELPICGQCPPILDDPAKICSGEFRWGFNVDPDAKIPDQPGGVPLKDMFDPLSHDFELWVFFGGAGLATPASCTPASCLYESFPEGSFVKVREGRWLYQNPNAAMGSPQFISKIDIRERSGAIHFGVDGLVATPPDGKVSLVISQMGKTIVVNGTPVAEPTVSLGIDRRHDSWKGVACGYRLHDAGGVAPGIFCAPPLGGQCIQPPDVCAKRRCLFAAEVRRNPNGNAVVELHVGVKPSLVPVSSQPITVTFQRTSAPQVSVDVASVSPGQMNCSGKKCTLRQTNLRLNTLQRNDGLVLLDVIGKVSLPPLAPQDDLIVTIMIGPDSFSVPATPGPWSTNANGNPVIKGGTGGLPFCPKGS